MAKPDMWVTAILGVGMAISTAAYIYKENKNNKRQANPNHNQNIPSQNSQQPAGYSTPQWMPPQPAQPQGGQYQDPYASVYGRQQQGVEPELGDSWGNQPQSPSNTNEIWLDDGDDKWNQQPTQSSGWK